MNLTKIEKDELIYPIVNVYLDLETELLKNISKFLVKGTIGSESAKWQINKLAELGKLNKENLKTIAKMTGGRDKELYNTLYSAAEMALDDLEPSFRKLAKQGLLHNTDVPVSNSIKKTIAGLHKQAVNSLNLVNTVMGISAKKIAEKAIYDISDDLFRQQKISILDKGAARVLIGAESLHKSMFKTIREMTENGVPAFYDKLGRKWSPEAYVRMDMFTTVGNAARQATFDRMKDYGANLIHVSSHPGARPLCYPYQDGVFSTDGTSGTTTDFDENEIKYTPLDSTSYGKAAGLFGINCGHMASPFIGGFSDLTYEQYPDKEANDKLYKERQEQRRLEREVRKTKNTLLLADESGLRGTYEYINSARKLRQQKNTLNSYAEKHNLRVDNKRLQVAEYGHSASAKAVWAERKSVDKIDKKAYNIHEDIINNYNLNVRQGSQDKHIFGRNNYVEGKSILTADPQMLIDLYAGKSEIRLDKNNNFTNKEYFVHSEIIGIYKNSYGLEIPTNRGTIHYSKKKGAHIVPAKPYKE